MHLARRAPFILIVGLAAVSLLSGCRSGGELSGAIKASDDPRAVALLKRSMDVYAAMPSFVAESRLTISSQGQISSMSDRSFAYRKPNRFRVVSASSSGLSQTSVSNGVSLLEFDNAGRQPPRKLPAPDSITEVGTIQLMNPMFCGTLLYQFFGGKENYGQLVDATKGPVTFGSEEKVSTGEEAQVVKFYAKQQYGHVEALIGEVTGLVFRLRYDSEPLLKMLQDPVALDRMRADAGSRLSGTQDAKAKAETQTALSKPGQIANMSLESEETYTNLGPLPNSASLFNLVPPKGSKPRDFGASRPASPKTKP
jgi:hypothetical protein